MPINNNNISNTIDEIAQGILNFISSLLNKQITLDELAGKSSAEIDNVVLQEIAKGNSFVAGKFTIKRLNDTAFKYSFEVYFKKPNGEWQELSGESHSMPMNYLQEADREELKSVGEIDYEIDPPNLTAPPAGNSSATGETEPATTANPSAATSDVSVTDLLRGVN